MDVVLHGFGALAVACRGFDDGVSLFTVACDPALDLPLFPGLKPALDYWECKRAGRLMPGRDDLDPGEMVEFLPRIMLADVEHAPLRFRYRLCGTGICHVNPFDPTHLTADALLPRAYGALIHGQYAGVLATGLPALHLNVFDNHDRYHSYAHLILPLSRDHTTIDMIMTVDSANQDQAKMMNLLVQLQRRAGIELGDFYLIPANRAT